ncbi:armadillo repeat-containing protein 7-like [Hibiscus syriacus]|uniref:armadillo repeat-containing protein 7-like n=1 Tax=Hibiscus syriacus TaxID=106335 RepID=UPI0019234248|nr:armadillo repeat-containing protein 7-like [Hibiscus syriacus]
MVESIGKCDLMMMAKKLLLQGCQNCQELKIQLQELLDKGFKEKIAANLANFAYVPYNYSFLRQVQIPVFSQCLELFLDCIIEPNEKLVEFGIGGVCNSCVDPTNAAIVTTPCGGIPLVHCLSSPVRNM